MEVVSLDSFHQLKPKMGYLWLVPHFPMVHILNQLWHLQSSHTSWRLGFFVVQFAINEPKIQHFAWCVLFQGLPLGYKIKHLGVPDPQCPFCGCTSLGSVEELNSIGARFMTSFSLFGLSHFPSTQLFQVICLESPINSPRYEILSEWRSYTLFGRIEILLFFLTAVLILMFHFMLNLTFVTMY